MTINNQYKLTVSAVILNKDGQVLLAHNKDHEADFWKFPQGGVETNENHDEAVKRELGEELQCDDFEIVKKSEITYKYEWPSEVQERKGFIGPKVFFYFINYLGNKPIKPNLVELDQVKWVNANELVECFNTIPAFQDTVASLIRELKSL